ncbi:MAG: serine protease, partial [Caldimonas sp.]
RYSQSFRNEAFVRLTAQHQTKPRCNEEYIDREGLPLRAVICLRAYKKLPQLYDVAVLVTTLDQNVAGVQGRFDAQGVSFANAQKLARHYLDAFRWAH